MPREPTGIWLLPRRPIRLGTTAPQVLDDPVVLAGEGNVEGGFVPGGEGVDIGVHLHQEADHFELLVRSGEVKQR